MAIETLIKQPSESRVYSMDFSANMSNSEVISSVSSVTVDITGLTLGLPVFAKKKAQVSISGGVSGVQYKITWVVVTNLGNVLEAEGNLKVENL